MKKKYIGGLAFFLVEDTEKIIEKLKEAGYNFPMKCIVCKKKIDKIGSISSKGFTCRKFACCITVLLSEKKEALI